MTGVAPFRPGKVLLGSGVAAAVGWIGWGVGLAIAPDRALWAWLAAYVFAVTIALGALAMLMIGHAVGSVWFVVVRRVVEALAGTMPVFLLLFVPIGFGMEVLYPWVPPLEGLDHHQLEVVLKKQAWLDVPFFLARAGFYLLVWTLLATALRRWSLRQDADPDRAPRSRAVAISSGGLMAFGFTSTFASFDWVMSLAPAWQSTVFGGYLFAGAMTSGLGAILVAVRGLERSGELAGRVRPSHYHALGRLLLTFCVFWAYMAYSQGFLIWIADLPHEVTWYLDRWGGGWSWVLVTLVTAQFGVPFFALLSRTLKRRGGGMALMGAWVLAAHYVDVFWLVLPALDAPDHGLHWLDLPALLAVVGTAVAFGAWRLGGHPVLPWRDSRLPRSLEYHSP